MSYIYPIDTLMKWNGNRITEHNRGPISINPEKFMNEKRMVNTTLRRYVTGEKRTWSVSWEEVFSSQAKVVDHCWSGEEMLRFYNQHPGAFTLELVNRSANATALTSSETVLVMFQEFSHTVSKRTVQCDWWNISVTLVEV